MGQPSSGLVDGEPIKRVKGGRMYKIVTREYMAQGHDGYEALSGQKYLIDDESGQMMSTIVRKYLLGAFSFIYFSRIILTVSQAADLFCAWPAWSRRSGSRSS